MIEEEAIVTQVEGARVAVEKERRSACSGCQQTCASGMTDKLFGTKTVSLWATAPDGVKPGDRVVIGLPEDTLVKGAFLIYLLPLLGLFLGAVLGNTIATHAGVSSADLLSAAGGLAGMAIFLLGIRFSPFKHGADAKPVVLRKVS